MDSFTQDMVDRARKRRELLNKKLADTSSPLRKRSAPLGENQSINTQPSPPPAKSDDSPNKRQCVREEENVVKPDTPAIQGVRSRLQQLSSQRSAWSHNENLDSESMADIPSPHKAPEPVLMPQKEMCETSGLGEKTTQRRRNRLAALAHQINSYEDDLSHPTIKKEEKASKVWQPPKSAIPSSPVPADSPHKPPRTYEQSPIKQATSSPLRSHSPVKPLSPTKNAPQRVTPQPESPVKASPHRQVSSPLKKTNEAPVAVSKLSVTLGDSSVAKPSQVAEPKPSGVVLRKPKGAVSGASAVASPSGGEAEPTKRPVSARLAAWQDKVNAVVDEVNSTAVPLKDTGGSMKNRVASWKKPVTDHITSATNHTADPTSPRKLPSSPTKVPVGSATRSMHDNLSQMQERWKENDITEKVKQERKTELDALNNRWKKGEQDNAEKQDATEKPAPVMSGGKSVPAPPPLPSPTKVTTPTHLNKKQSAKKEANPDHIRAGDDAEEEVGGGRASSTDTDTPYFENNLKAMGFAVNSVADLGHVATLDLTPQRQRDAAAKQAAAPSSSPTVGSPKKTVPALSSVPPRANLSTPAPGSAVSCRSTAGCTPGAGRSLYSLIRGNKAAPNTGPQSSSALTSRAQPAPVTSLSLDDEDSFEEDMSSCEDTHAPVSALRTTSQTSIDSQSSQYSETCTESSLGTQEEEYEYDEETTQSEDVTTTEADEESEEYTDSEEEGGEGVDDLLDEALDDSYVPPHQISLHPQPAPRHLDPPRSALNHQQHTRQTTTSGADAEEAMRRVRWASGTQGGSSTSYQSSSATESEVDDQPVVYSINQYRRQNMEKRKSSTEATQIIVVPQKSPPKKTQPVPQPRQQHDIKQKLKELQEQVNQEQSIIMQTSNALNQCCGSNSSFAGSMEAVECHRLLLIACRKREAYMTEMQLLREGRSISQRSGGPQGSLTIEDIRLPLKHDFMTTIGTPKDTSVHYFLVMLRHAGKAIFTEMVSTHDALVRGALHFQNFIKISDIGQDFRVDLEVYGMSVTREPVNTPKKKRGLTPKKGSSSKRLAMPSPGGPYAVRTTNFTLLASQVLTMASVDRTSFNLERLPISSPLQGSIHLKLHCLMEADVELRGFLTMFEDVCGFGAWHRRWCVIKSNLLSFWKYPDEEHTKEPIGYIDLKMCITDVVGLIARDICARPNSFELRTVRRQFRGETDTLVSKCYNTMTTTKHWLSADTKEDRAMWCNHLNEALHSVRAWHPDALRPFKPIKSTNPHPTESNI